MGIFKNFVRKHLGVLLNLPNTSQVQAGIEVFDEFITDDLGLSLDAVGTKVYTSDKIKLINSLISYNIPMQDDFLVALFDVLTSEASKEYKLNYFLSVHFSRYELSTQRNTALNVREDAKGVYLDRLSGIDPFALDILSSEDGYQFILSLGGMQRNFTEQCIENILTFALNTFTPFTYGLIEYVQYGYADFQPAGTVLTVEAFITLCYNGVCNKINNLTVIKADGRQLELERYYKLFKTIGYTYGGSGAYFNIQNINNAYVYAGSILELYNVGEISLLGGTTDETLSKAYLKKLRYTDTLIFSDSYLNPNFDGDFTALTNIRNFIFDDSNNLCLDINIQLLQLLDLTGCANNVANNTTLFNNIIARGLSGGTIIVRTVYAPSSALISAVNQLGWVVTKI